MFTELLSSFFPVYLPSIRDQKKYCRYSYEFRQLKYNIEQCPHDKKWTIKVVYTDKISPVFEECLREDGFKVVSSSNGNGVDYELHNGHIKNVPCLWTTISRV